MWSSNMHANTTTALSAYCLSVKEDYNYLLFNYWLKEQNRQVLTLTDECHADIADIIVMLLSLSATRPSFYPPITFAA